MEFSKMQLLLQHPEAAKLAWNDQSWFYSQVFAAIFDETGFQCGVPRLATLAIVICLLFAISRLMPRNTGWPHLICAWLCFWCWPQIPHLSVAAMLELPAFGLAIITAALAPRDRSEWRIWRFLIAAVLFAIAAQVKLTVLIILPALAVKIFLLWWCEIHNSRTLGPANNSALMFRWWISPLLGCVAFAGTYFLIACWSPTWDWSQLWSSHFAAGSTTEANQYRLEPSELFHSPGTLAGALLGIIVLWRQRNLYQIAFPLVLLLTVLIIHFNHRPWWYYYGIHFAVPLAMLAGWGTAELLRVAMSNRIMPQSTESVFSKDVSMMLGVFAISLLAGFEFSHGYENTLQVGMEETIADNDVINVIKPYHGRVKWIFTQRNILAAQAGFALPPELTILAKKRYWTGQINSQKILDTVKRYQCEILILYPDGGLEEKAWKEFLDKDYVNVWSANRECVFVAKSLNRETF